MHLILSVFFSLISFTMKEKTINVKCMVQMLEYRGEAAYVAISVVNADGEYVKTLYVMGNDKTWFSDMKAFWKHLRANDLYTDDTFYPMIDGITGATLSGGRKRVIPLNIPVILLDKGYTLRFETAVEDKGYHTNDVSLDFSESGLNKSYTGSGFIQHIKFLLPDS